MTVHTRRKKKKTPTVNNFGKCRHDVYFCLGLRNNDLNHSMLKHPASIYTYYTRDTMIAVAFLLVFCQFCINVPFCNQLITFVSEGNPNVLYLDPFLGVSPSNVCLKPNLVL